MDQTDDAFTTMEQLEQADRQRWVWINRLALVLALGLLAVRCKQLETIRDPVAPLVLQPAGNLPATPEGPGATVSVVLSWLGFLPMLLVLTRRSVDSTYRLHTGVWVWPMGLLALLALMSVAWAGDRYESLIQAMAFASGLSMLWASSQIVRSWRALRVVAGMAVGLLLVFVAQAFIYRYVEWPVLLETWNQTKTQFFQQRGWQPDSFEAQQFERNITNRAMLGFFSSPNTYAAISMLGMFTAVGVLVQRQMDQDDAGWIAVPLLGGAGGLALLVWSGSRTAMLGGVLGVGLLGAYLIARRTPIKPGQMWWGLIAACVLVVCALVAIGLVTGGLLHESLTFRWRYWMGSMAMVLDRPLLGTGWANFGQAYLEHRLPAAAEEIKDPHNAVVRFATELGIGGLVLGLAWLVFQSRAVLLGVIEARPSQSRVEPKLLLLVVVVIVAASVWCAVDLHADAHFAFIEVLKRTLFGGLIALGWLTTCLRSGEEMRLDDRPAPWLLLLITTGLGVFVMHSMVDMVMLETGPLLFFGVLVGAIAGLRTLPRQGTDRHAIAVFVGVVLLAGWLVSAAMVVVPIARAEEVARRADQAIVNRDLTAAVQAMKEATRLTPVRNADFVSRLASLTLLTEPPTGTAASSALDTIMDQLVEANPSRVQSYIDRARYLRLRGGEPERVMADFEQAIQRNPREISIRLEFADYLQSVGQKPRAIEQLQRVLDINQAYDPDETRRLAPSQLEQTRQALDRLRQ